MRIRQLRLKCAYREVRFQQMMVIADILMFFSFVYNNRYGNISKRHVLNFILLLKGNLLTVAKIYFFSFSPLANHFGPVTEKLMRAPAPWLMNPLFEARKGAGSPHRH